MSHDALTEAFLKVRRSLLYLNEVAVPKLKPPEFSPENAIALADAYEERCGQLLQAVALLRHEAQNAIKTRKEIR